MQNPFETTIESKVQRNGPMEELTFLFGKFGWETRLCDLTEKQVISLIYGIQEANKIEDEHDLATIERTYVESTGTWPVTSIPF